MSAECSTLLATNHSSLATSRLLRRRDQRPFRIELERRRDACGGGAHLVGFDAYLVGRDSRDRDARAGVHPFEPELGELLRLLKDGGEARAEAELVVIPRLQLG